jgi:hypothetical protein
LIAYLVSSLDSDPHGLKDHILANENVPTAANAYSRLLLSSLGQNSTVNGSTVTSLESFVLVLNSGCCGSFCGGCGDCGFHGGSHGHGGSKTW